ncbi:MAG TPA: MlaD family protein [Solirubrobacteraceae bacterium]
MTRGARHDDRRDPALAGIAVVLVLAAALAFALTKELPFVGDDGRLVTAEFPTARQVNGDTPVRVRGVSVGNVESVDYDEARRVSTVRFRVTDDDVRLRADATAALRWRTALGGRMELALEPGSAVAPLRGPIRRTRIQSELEDVTRVFQDDGGDGIRAFLRELPKALQGPQAGSAIDALAPRLRTLGPATRALRGERTGDLRRLVRSAARVTAATGRTHTALSAFVSGAAQTFRTTADRDAQLRATFRFAPPALRATTGAAREIDATLPQLDALVRELRPGARRLGPALAATTPTIRRLRTVLDAARPLVRRLRPAVSRLATAAVAGNRLLTGLDPTIRRTADDLVPYLERKDDDLGLPVYQLIGPGIATLGAAGGHYTQIGHFVNFPVQPGEGSQTFLPCATFLADPTATEKLRCDAVNRALRTLLTMGRR